MTLRVLLLSAYDAPSHRRWRQCLQRELDDWQWTVLTQPPRHFSWRVRGNPLAWSLEERDTLQGDYDLLLATSMVDLATLRGLVPQLGQLPAVYYFHENQFAYPRGQGEHGLLEAQMVSLYGALSASLLLFNSGFNRDTFLEGCRELLHRLPDGTPPDVVEHLAAKSQVLPVPLDLPACDAVTAWESGSSLQLLWNHRWEYDKGPAQLLELAQGLITRNVDFTLHVVGQQFRRQPPEFAQLREALAAAGALGQWGYMESVDAYRDLLGRCHVVLSTALHDFQGLSMLEAVALGCRPLAPRALAYPEWFEDCYLYDGAEQAIAQLEQLQQALGRGETVPRPEVGGLGCGALIPRYRELLHSQARCKSVS